MTEITNTEVFGLHRVFKTAKYPKSVDVDAVDNTLTPGIEKCMTAPSGSGHDNALKGIIVLFDLKMPIKTWVEAERYHFLDFVSSQSTMHKIHLFDIRKQCNDYVDDIVIENAIKHQEAYIKTHDEKELLKLLYNIPVGFEYTAGMVANYQQLKTIYNQRKTHRLPDWHVFCEWIEGLPYSELITGGDSHGGNITG